MKTILRLILPICTAALGVAGLAKTNPAQQELLVGEDNIIAKQGNRVPGHNDASYDVVRKEDQLYRIEGLEIAPTPFSTDRAVFILLSGNIPESKKKELGLPDEGLTNATLKIGASVVYSDGTHDDEQSYTVPLKTTPFAPLAHLVIRDARGVQVDYLPSSDDSDILVDFQFLPMFMKSGMYTFKVDARLGDVDDTCLFAMSLTQWLEGRL
ncbi:hypothetical protein BJX62DRAFT_215163 [Aspergillus germanicus]